jgi:hypothetical protein
MNVFYDRDPESLTRLQKILTAVGICIFLVVAGIVFFCFNLFRRARDA